MDFGVFWGGSSERLVAIRGGGLMIEKWCKIQNSIREVGGCPLYMKQSVKFNHLIVYLFELVVGSNFLGYGITGLH